MSKALPVLVLAVVLLGGCTAPVVQSQRPSPTPTPAAVSVLTPDTDTEARSLDPIIGQLVLTTEVGNDEAPKEQRSAFPVNAKQLYLVVRASEMPAGTRLTAVWLRGANEIGRSEREIREPIGSARWIALGFQSTTPLPSGEYSVRLFLDDRFVDSVVFTVGSRREQGSEETGLVFAPEFPSSGAIQAMSEFPVGTTRVVAILTDVPPDLQGELWSRWSVDGSVLTELGPDELRMAFVRSFTLQRSEPLPPGLYSVQVFAGQQPIAEGSFLIAGATPTPEVPVVGDAVVEDLRIVRAVEPGTGVPVGARITQVRSPARLYVAVLVRDLQPGDVLEVVWERAGQEWNRQTVSGLTLPANWISLPFDLPAESGGEPVEYAVNVLLNGTLAQRVPLTVLPGA